MGQWYRKEGRLGQCPTTGRINLEHYTLASGQTFTRGAMVSVAERIGFASALTSGVSQDVTLPLARS